MIPVFRATGACSISCSILGPLILEEVLSCDTLSRKWILTLFNYQSASPRRPSLIPLLFLLSLVPLDGSRTKCSQSQVSRKPGDSSNNSSLSKGSVITIWLFTGHNKFWKSNIGLFPTSKKVTLVGLPLCQLLKKSGDKVGVSRFPLK